MSRLSEMVKTMSDKILNLERELADQTRRANVAEAWQRRLTSLLANPQEAFSVVAWQKRHGSGDWLNITVNKPEDLPDELGGLRKVGWQLRPLYTRPSASPLVQETMDLSAVTPADRGSET